MEIYNVLFMLLLVFLEEKVVCSSSCYPPVNCKISTWSRWTSCRSTSRCGVVISRRTRRITHPQQCGGRCLVVNLDETRFCRGKCYNGGYFSMDAGCLCTSGYTGTCCEQCEYLFYWISQPTISNFHQAHTTQEYELSLYFLSYTRADNIERKLRPSKREIF